MCVISKWDKDTIISTSWIHFLVYASAFSASFFDLKKTDNERGGIVRVSDLRKDDDNGQRVFVYIGDRIKLCIANDDDGSREENSHMQAE